MNNFTNMYILIPNYIDPVPSPEKMIKVISEYVY